MMKADKLGILIALANQSSWFNDHMQMLLHLRNFHHLAFLKNKHPRACNVHTARGPKANSTLSESPELLV